MTIEIPKDELEIIMLRLKAIKEHSLKLTSGNVSHIKPNICGNADLIIEKINEYVTKKNQSKS